MSIDFDQIVENHFKEKRDIFGFKGIAELIEEVLEAYPGVKEAAVIGTPHEKWGEAVTACVVGEVNLKDLDAALKEIDLAAFKRPRRYLFLEMLPRNAANKVLRRELKDLAGQGNVEEVG